MTTIAMATLILTVLLSTTSGAHALSQPMEQNANYLDTWTNTLYYIQVSVRHLYVIYILGHVSEAQRFLHRHLLTCVLPTEARVRPP